LQFFNSFGVFLHFVKTFSVAGNSAEYARMEATSINGLSSARSIAKLGASILNGGKIEGGV